MATEEETLEANQETAFQIIATVGSAKSQYIEAIQKAKEGDIEGAKALIESGNKDFNEGHTAHLSLLQPESFRIIAEDFIDVYEKLNAKLNAKN